jgi:predicted nuclease with TOPRIM domain
MEIPEIVLHWKRNYEELKDFTPNGSNYLEELRSRAIDCISIYKEERERIKQRENDKLELKKFFDKLDKL